MGDSYTAIIGTGDTARLKKKPGPHLIGYISVGRNTAIKDSIICPSHIKDLLIKSAPRITAESLDRGKSVNPDYIKILFKFLFCIEDNFPWPKGNLRQKSIFCSVMLNWVRSLPGYMTRLASPVMQSISHDVNDLEVWQLHNWAWWCSN